MSKYQTMPPLSEEGSALSRLSPTEAASLSPRDRAFAAINWHAPRPDRGRVYFMRNEASGLIKIGFSRYPEGRRRQIEHQERHPISLLASFPGSMADERAEHARFNRARAFGEWFRPCRDIFDRIAEVAR